MKITAICASPRKGNSYRALESIRESFPSVDYKILMLKDLNFEPCQGCYGCVLRGEDKCPIKDDRDMIIGEMDAADGLILASPVYSHMVSAIMKNFFERFGYMAHRPQFFDKYAMSVAICSGYGADEAIKYMNKMLSVFGLNLVPSLELQFRPGTLSEKNKLQNKEKIIGAVQNLIRRIEKGGRDKPSLNLMVPFNIFKYVSRLDNSPMEADFKYYADKGDYYYDTSINPLKKFIARRVSNNIIKTFD